MVAMSGLSPFIGGPQMQFLAYSEMNDEIAVLVCIVYRMKIDAISFVLWSFSPIFFYNGIISCETIGSKQPKSETISIATISVQIKANILTSPVASRIFYWLTA